MKDRRYEEPVMRPFRTVRRQGSTVTAHFMSAAEAESCRQFVDNINHLWNRGKRSDDLADFLDYLVSLSAKEFAAVEAEKAFIDRMATETKPSGVD